MVVVAARCLAPRCATGVPRSPAWEASTSTPQTFSLRRRVSLRRRYYLSVAHVASGDALERRRGARGAQPGHATAASGCGGSAGFARVAVPSGYPASVGDYAKPAFEMDRLVSYDDASILAEVRRVVGLLPPGPVTRNDFDALSRVASSTVIRRFSGWMEALAAAGFADRYGGKRVTPKMRDQRARSATADDMIVELQRISEKVGRKAITRADLLQHADLMSERALINRFGTWKAALEAAGLELSAMGRRWTDDDYFENLLDAWTHHGRAPTYDEMNRAPSRITNGAYAAKFGTWGMAKLAFVERVNRDIEQGELEAAIPRVPSPIAAKARQEDQHSMPIGLRYQVLRRDRFRCVTCGRSPAVDPGCALHVDHTRAFSRGGKTRLDNLRTLCKECNLGKGTGDE